MAVYMIAVYFYIFSVVALVFAVWVKDIFPQSTAFSSITLNSIDQLIERHTIGLQPDPQMVYGDFILALQVVFGIITGDVFTIFLSGLPFINIYILYIFRAVVTISQVFLWVYILTGRGI